MAKIYTDGKLKTIATREWVNAQSGGTPGNCEHPPCPPCEPCIHLVEVEYDTEALTFDPTAKIIGGETIPTEKIINSLVERVQDTFGIDLSIQPTAWDTLNALTHEESLALIEKHKADGEPVRRFLTFWEYRRLFPDGLTRDVYKARRLWIFEYNGTTWEPTELFENIGELENE